MPIWRGSKWCGSSITASMASFRTLRFRRRNRSEEDAPGRRQRVSHALFPEPRLYRLFCSHGARDDDVPLHSVVAAPVPCAELRLDRAQLRADGGLPLDGLSAGPAAAERRVL